MITIVIQNVTIAPAWATTQQMLREVTGNPDGRLVRIDREDRGVDYRAPGIYNLTFEPRRGACCFPVRLEVTRNTVEKTVEEAPGV